MDMPPVVKKHGLVIVGALVGLYVVYKYIGGSSSSASNSAASSSAGYAAMLAANTAAAAQSNQAQLQQQQLQVQQTAVNGQIQAQQTQAAGLAATQIGSALSGIIAAQSLLPADAINQVAAMNQTTLSSAAKVATAGIASLPGTLYGAAQLSQATAAPIGQYAAALNGFDTTLAYTGANAMNSLVGVVTPSVNSASTAAAASANANAAATAATMSAISSVATAAIAA